MDDLHPQLDHGVSIDELNSAVSDLSAQVTTLTDDELMVGVLRIVAMVSAEGCDAHTGAYVWGNGEYPVDSLPLRLWLFDDGVYVVDALPPYEDLIGQRIDAVNGRATDDVIDMIDPIVPRDNDQTVRLLMPRFLLIPQILAGVGVVDDVGTIDLLIGTSTRNPTTVTVNPIPMAEYNTWAGPYGLHLPADPNVPYLSSIDETLWQKESEDGTLFVQYNRVDFVSTTDLTLALEDPATERVILDLRHNFGGELSALDPIDDAITAYAVAHPGSLYVITGRNTFSAGSMLVARLDAQTDAVIVGEAMGGCTVFWADVEDLALPFSGIDVSVSTFFEVSVDPGDDRVTIGPDIPAPLTPTEWAAGIDPALRAIQAAQD